MASFQSPPCSEPELLRRTESLAGKTFQKVAAETGLALPADHKRAKGWAGEIAEVYLGATAANRSEPDFLDIGVELKTLPLGGSGLPRESTYVCSVALREMPGQRWKNSPVRRKLSRVLWLPLEADKSIPFDRRRFGSAFLWSPGAEDEAILENDWNELMELVTMGRLDEISSTRGVYLQIRPKAANARSLGKSFDTEGRPIETLPRGFYLRTAFTKKILERHLE